MSEENKITEENFQENVNNSVENSVENVENSVEEITDIAEKPQNIGKEEAIDAILNEVENTKKEEIPVENSITGEKIETEQEQMTLRQIYNEDALKASLAILDKTLFRKNTIVMGVVYCLLGVFSGFIGFYYEKTFNLVVAVFWFFLFFASLGSHHKDYESDHAVNSLEYREIRIFRFLKQSILLTKAEGTSGTDILPETMEDIEIPMDQKIRVFESERAFLIHQPKLIFSEKISFVILKEQLGLEEESQLREVLKAYHCPFVAVDTSDDIPEHVSLIDDTPAASTPEEMEDLIEGKK